jgi:hypothetical protein
MTSITKRTTYTTVRCARRVLVARQVQAAIQVGAVLLLLLGTPAMTANKSIDSKASPSKAGGEPWLQDRNKAEELLHIKDASGSVYLAAKLSSPEDIKSARDLLRKSVQELAQLPPARSKQAIGEQIGKLISDFAFLQSSAYQTDKSANEGTTIQHLKNVSGDYEVLIPAAEKQLGPNDPQVKSLKVLRGTFNESFEDYKRFIKNNKQ